MVAYEHTHSLDALQWSSNIYHCDSVQCPESDTNMSQDTKRALADVWLNLHAAAVERKSVASRDDACNRYRNERDHAGHVALQMLAK